MRKKTQISVIALTLVSSLMLPFVMNQSIFAGVPVTPPITPPETPTSTPVTPPVTPTATATTTATSTPTVTSTPTATATSTSTSTPTSSATPTATPFNNQKPVILTKSLPIGRIGRPYSATISGYDLNVNDRLTIGVAGIPEQLTLKNCSSYIAYGRKNMTCTLSGISKYSGIHVLNVSIWDNYNNMTTKNLVLSILPW